ncbi:hypothetical protein [Altererythrobacter fulvus]|uniref:hypothetical protein n=1 Tax=Caenibius fulvus TaxID=2126012 RepID=UPI003015A932
MAEQVKPLRTLAKRDARHLFKGIRRSIAINGLRISKSGRLRGINARIANQAWQQDQHPVSPEVALATFFVNVNISPIRINGPLLETFLQWRPLREKGAANSNQQGESATSSRLEHLGAHSCPTPPSIPTGKSRAPIWSTVIRSK